MFRRQSRLAHLSGDGSELSLSQGSSKSKSLDSTEDLSKSSTISSPEANSKKGGSGSISSIRSKSSVLLQEPSDTDFRVRIIGCIENIHGIGSGPLDVINLIDIAQQENELPLIVNEEAVMSLTVHGIKLSKHTNNTVIYRIPIHLIERIVVYEDGLVGNTTLAVKCVRSTAKAYSDGPYDIHAYQCENKVVAQELCSRFNHILETAVSTTSPSKIILTRH